jgi:hypothetical protein
MTYDDMGHKHETLAAMIVPGEKTIVVTLTAGGRPCVDFSHGVTPADLALAGTGLTQTAFHAACGEWPK